MAKKEARKGRSKYKEASKDSSEGSSKESKDSSVVKFFKVILWPFKMLFILLSWIVKIVVLFFEGLINVIKFLIDKILGLFRKHEQKVYESNPLNQAKYAAFTSVKPISGSFSTFENVLAKSDSTIGIILGARGSGKSAFGLKLLENLHSLNNRKIFAMGFKTSELPGWIHTIEDIEQIENGSYVLIDEGGILFNARKGFSDANQLLSKLLLIARHKDLSIMFISQNSSNLEINAIRQADYLALKPSSLLQLDFERKKIKDVYVEVAEDFAKYKSTKGLTYIYSDKFKGFITNPLPSFWTQNISKSFSGKDKKEEKDKEE